MPNNIATKRNFQCNAQDLGGTMFDSFEILETQRMFAEEHLDVRTITMGINLLDCISKDPQVACENIYNKITTKARDLVKVAHDISKEFGIPIVNKRISVTPISLVAGATDLDNYLIFAQTLDRAAKDIGVDFIGGFSALVEKGYTKSDKILINSLPEALAKTERVCASVNVGTSRYGINMDAIRDLGPIILETAELTKNQDAYGCAKFVVFANATGDNPFMAGAFHGVGEGDTVINVGVSGPGVVLSTIENANEKELLSLGDLANLIKRSSFKITRVGQLVAQEAAKRLGVSFGIIDLSLAPTPVVGDSIARILESMGLESTGAWGTTAALAMLNDAVKKGGTMASSQVGGLSGAFIPVSEDEGMIEAVRNGALSLEKLEAMTSVCSVGIDMVAIPGDTSAQIISGIIADESAIGVFNNKTTAVRIIPVPDKTVGDSVVYGGLWGEAPIMAVNQASPATFINRGGRIPAPIHSFKS